MTKKSLKAISTMLAIALVLSLSVAVQITANAANTNVEFTESDYVPELQAKIQSAINASSSGDTVTVIGITNTQIGDTLHLDIKAGVTVIWKIQYGCPYTVDSLICLSGSGTFEVAEGGWLAIHDEGYVILVEGNNPVIVSGGTVYSGDGSAAIQVTKDNANVIVSAGRVMNDSAYGNAINAQGANSNITVSGGVVSATVREAIKTSGLNTKVTVDAGFVFAYGDEFYGEQKVIYLSSPGTLFIGDDAVVCAWEKPMGIATYAEGSSTDLTVTPPGATARWSFVNDRPGIRFYRGATIGFFPLDDKVIVDVENAVNLMDNFEKVNEYTVGMFSDVSEDAWYGYNGGKYIATVYEYGLMVGNSSGTFNPFGSMSIAEAITIATRMHNYYMTGQQLEFVPIPGEPWYMGNVWYAVHNGMIALDSFDSFTQAATRAEMAYIFCLALPPAELPPQNTVNALPDVNSETRYYEAIFMLYRAGILEGASGTAAFRPDDNITRAEVAAIVSRMILPTTRFAGKVYG